MPQESYVNSNLSHLESLIASCLTSDQPRLSRKFAKLKQRLDDSLPASRLLDELTGEVNESQIKVDLRRAAFPVVSYPDLPVSGKREVIKEAIQSSQVVVVAGETGSGKTTQLPKICLDLGLGELGLIGHTQPRRLAARTVATRIAEELGTNIGEGVGYQVRFTDEVGELSLIKLMTDGILLAETQHDPLLSKYQVIIIDEAHERSLNIDFLLGYIKRILPKRPDLKVIITSATIDLERFSEHFDNAPIIEVSGRTYPVDVIYRPLQSEDDDQKERSLQQGICDAVEEIIAMDRAERITGPRDVLVFLSGEREIREAADRLRKMQLRDTEIMPLYARLSVAEQTRVFDNQRHVGRRIVLATNVAETSVTVPNIRYVIDTGVARISRYSYRSKVQRLPIEAISQASANQRAGRCGRIAAGVCIRLYSEEDYKLRPEFTDAEIRRTNLAAVILQMLNLKLGNIADFPFIDPPDSRFISDGFKLLEELGAVSPRRQMTALGKRLSQLPVDPRIGRMVLEASKQGALKEVLVIASALSVQDPRERPMDKQQAADQAHAVYVDEHSDFLTVVNLWNSYESLRQELSQSQLRKHCQKSFLSFMRMREWRDIHRQLLLSCRQLGLKENSESADYKEIHISLLAGLLSHMGFRQENKEYLGARNRRFHLFPASALFKKPAKWIMAAELVETTKLYARMVARIEPEWAERLASHLIKRSYLEPVWQKKRAQVTAIEQVSLFGLLIIPKRTVNYGAIDPDVSHQIFIRSALVEGHYDTKARFFNHNQQLLNQIEGLEAKIRRKDLLVDEEALYDFYAERFRTYQGEHVVNGAGFEKWRKQLEHERPDALCLTEEDLLQRSTSHISQSAYPDEIKHKGMHLKLHYHFEPGAEDDGVTLSVPIALLKQLPLKRLEWLVPGMLQDKCTALLKGLPKQRRKNFVPIPDYASALYEAMVFGDGDLYEAMCLQLLRMTGVKLDPSELRDVVLPDHWRMNMRVKDAAGKQIAQGRDWQRLCEQYGHQAEKALESSPEQSWGRQGITRWDFGVIPDKIQLRQAGGIHVDAWPALQDKQESVELLAVMDAAKAKELTIQGVIRLALLALVPQIRACRKALSVHSNESVLYTGKIFNRKMLEEQILIQSVRSLMALDNDLPKDEASFELKVETVKDGLEARIYEISKLVLAIHKQYHQVVKHLNGRVDLSTVTILNDIKSQLVHLIDKTYISNISWSVLQQYPRYMDAILYRIEKYPREIPRQRMLSEQLHQWWEQYAGLKSLLEKRGSGTDELMAFRWYLEEYRVSLFAQQLGTQEPVSEKRVRQRWQSLQPD